MHLECTASLCALCIFIHATEGHHPFFQGLGFSLGDYGTMYHTAVVVCPRHLIKDKHFIATFVLIDHPQKLEKAFSTLAQAVAGTTSDTRLQVLATGITCTVTDVLDVMQREVRPS